MLIGLGFVLLVQPLADAAVSRATVRSADGYTARLGAGPDLADALQACHTGESAGRWRASHPPLGQRVQVLRAGATVT